MDESKDKKNVTMIKTNKASGVSVLPVGKRNHVRLLGKGRPFARQEKTDGVQCLNELPLEDHSMFLAASVLLF